MFINLILASCGIFKKKFFNLIYVFPNYTGYNNDFKSFNNGRGGFHKRNDFRNNDRGNNGDQPSGFYRQKDYQQNDDFGNRGGYRSVSIFSFLFFSMTLILFKISLAYFF
jgi:hypothetical protein